MFVLEGFPIWSPARTCTLQAKPENLVRLLSNCGEDVRHPYFILNTSAYVTYPYRFDANLKGNSLYYLFYLCFT